MARGNAGENVTAAQSRRAWTWSKLIGVIVCLGFGLALSPSRALADGSSATSITVDGHSNGLVFDGEGAISGGGGNTRLLPDYPRARRNAILDYLFKPDYGADVQILKLEIGGDGNSTSGSESTIEETKGDINCNAGYEFWLAKQAVERDPRIKLYGLTWSAPAWVGSSMYTQNGIRYILDWLGCAHRHGLSISYVGGWNEHADSVGQTDYIPQMETWYPQLRSALDANGYRHVQIVAGDDNNNTWPVADAMASDPTFKNSAAVLGNHYPCSGWNGDNSPTTYLNDTSCSSTPTAQALGTPLWAAENGSMDFNDGGAPMARTDNLVYLQGRMVANINWPIVASTYSDVSFAGVGLIKAEQPWSGNYSVGLSTWAMAQTTQFAKPGWRYLDSSSGYLGGSTYQQGSYVSLVSPGGRNWSTIVETTRATGPQTLKFTIAKGRLSAARVHVWSTNLASTDPSTWFRRDATITPDGRRSFSVTVQPNQVYSFTTTTGQHKGTAVSPAPASFTLPYSDDFDSEAISSQPRYLGQMEGAFDVQPCVGRSGRCVQQETPTRPLEWGNYSPKTYPYTAGGGLDWSNYQVSADVMNAVPGSVGIMGRQENDGSNPYGGEDPTDTQYYSLTLSDQGAWAINRSQFGGTITTLASGTDSAAAGLHTWHGLALTFDGSRIVASIDGTTVGSAMDSTFSSGKIGLMTTGYTAGDQFDNLRVTPLTAPAVPVNVDLSGGSTTKVGYQSTSGIDSWAFTGAWNPNGNADSTSDDTAGDTATLTFTGSGVQLYADASDGQGIEDVSVDGGPSTPVDLYRDTGSGTLQQVYAVSGLDPTRQHTLTVTVTATKNPSSSGSGGSVGYALVDTAAAVGPVITHPTAGATLTTQRVMIRGTDSAADAVTVDAGGSVVCPDVPVSQTGQWHCAADLGTGSITLNAQAFDPVTGNLSAGGSSVPVTVRARGATAG